MRYVARRPKPKAWWGEDDWSEYDDKPESLTVDGPADPEFTGLYDKDGTPLYRVPEKIGF